MVCGGKNTYDNAPFIEYIWLFYYRICVTVLLEYIDLFSKFSRGLVSPFMRDKLFTHFVSPGILTNVLYWWSRVVRSVGPYFSRQVRSGPKIRYNPFTRVSARTNTMCSCKHAWATWTECVHVYNDVCFKAYMLACNLHACVNLLMNGTVYLNSVHDIYQQ